MISRVFVLPLLWLGAGIGVHLEEVEEVSPEAARSVLDSLGTALLARTGTIATADDPVWTECDSGDRCLENIRARTQAGELVMLRVFGGPKSTHLVAERIDAKNASKQHAKLTVEGTAMPDAAALAPLARELFPEPRAPTKLELSDAGGRALSPAPSYGPWILLGAGAVAAGVGILFGASSRSAGDRVAHEVLPGPESDDLSSRRDTHAFAANMLFGTAAAAGAGALLWMLFDD
jgi:hypothetical protein